VRIDTLREYAVLSVPPMHTARNGHASVYHSQYVYVLGGANGKFLSKCERYECAESQWEVLPPLPVASCWVTAVELDNSLYALGGYDGRSLDSVQKLSLDSLTWKLMQLKLPQTAH
jgi:N-acetylneuraminic acid mutarotase